MDQFIDDVLSEFGADRTRLIDMLWAVQNREGYISEAAMAALARGLNMSAPEVAETATFYHFFRTEPFGKHAIYLCDSVIARMNGYDEVRAALAEATGAEFGGVDPSGTFGVDDTPCIGLSDQEPAMLVDKVVFTRLTPEKVKGIVAAIRSGKSPEEVANPKGHDRRTVAYVDALVKSNLRQAGPVLFQADRDYREIIRSMLARKPDDIINDIIREMSDSGLRGRGGAGFPTGYKWKLGREAEGKAKYIICNADEGEPGTFKDRVILTRSPKDVLTGMVAAAFAVGATHGIIYLRAEYWYLKDFLEAQLDEWRGDNLLGDNILGSGLSFDIRIQMGAGSYVCGDETALIESCEGKRGTPRVKPPYPIQQGYLGFPTVVNNVETLALASRIVENSGRWFTAIGTEKSSGTRLLSVSGDCARPGVYEIEWGITLLEVLDMVGAEDTLAVQISGPAGECVSVERDGPRKNCYADLSCNGSLMVFDKSRDLLGIVRHFTQFFVHESCGICTPCRAGGVEMLTKIDRIIAGRAVQKDLDEIHDWARLMRQTSRCGLGYTAGNPLLTTLEKFPELYRSKLAEEKGPLLAMFDLEDAMSAYDRAVDTLVEEGVK